MSSCPVCRVKVERTKGCNKMVCIYCKNEWCWECGQSIDGYAHFNGKNGCGAGIFGERNERRHNRWLVIPAGFLCAFLFLPFVSLCPLYCVVGMFCTPVLREYPGPLFCILMSGSIAGWGYLYYYMYTASIYWIFLNVSLLLCFFCMACCIRGLI